MKANELMLGDLVYSPEGELCKVHMIEGRFEAFVTTDNYSHDDGTFYLYSIKEIQPIPITKEILEKNFNGADPYGIYFFGDEYIEVYIKEYTDGLWRVEVDEVEMGGLPTWKMYVSNIHELQHALRLCGVEKTIEL